MKKTMCAIMALAIGFAATAEVVQTGKNITVTGVGTVSVDAAELQVDVRPEAEVTVGKGAYPVTIHAANASVRLSNDGWKDKVVFWLDASKVDSFDMYEDNPGSFKTNGSKGIYPGNAVNISGGKLEASNIDANISLSYSNTDDYIKVDSYTSGKTMTIANGQTFTDGTTKVKPKMTPKPSTSSLFSSCSAANLVAGSPLFQVSSVLRASWILRRPTTLCLARDFRHGWTEFP